MSVGHVARLLEANGIATVAVYISAFEHYATQMRLPRTLITPHPMGRPIGPPGDVARQAAVVSAALDLFATATEGGTLAVMSGAYRPGLA